MSDISADDPNKSTNTALGLIAAVILVALIVGVLAYSNGREQERRHSQLAEGAETSKVEARRVCENVGPAAMIDCVHDQIVASQDQARAEQDLDAQQGMKFWAAVMAMLTLLTVCVTALGVWFVKRTLDATLEAVRDSGEATRAMREANSIARESVIAGNRAWLTVKEVDVSRLRYKFEGKSIVLFGDVYFLIENTGRSAANEIWTRSVAGLSVGIWTELAKEDESPHFREGLPPSGTTSTSAFLHVSLPTYRGDPIDIQPLRSALSISYHGGGEKPFTTECLYAISRRPDGRIGWNEKDLLPHPGQSGPLDAYGVFQYFGTVT